MKNYHAIIVGAGAAGMMCALTAAARGGNILLLEHNRDAARKILISGGGRCNFTNLHTTAENFHSQNKHFVKSALAQYTPQDFIRFIEKYNIDYFEKKHGQLFCTTSAKEIIRALKSACTQQGVHLLTGIAVQKIIHEKQFIVPTLVDGKLQEFTSQQLIIATGGLSLPTLGATDFGLKIARQFKLKTTATTPALVPLTLAPADLEMFHGMSGLALAATITVGKRIIAEDFLFTHKGFSGPVVLQASLYWEPKTPLQINFCPRLDLAQYLLKNKSTKSVKALLKDYLPAKFLQRWLQLFAPFAEHTASCELSDKALLTFAQCIQQFSIIPAGTEGFRKAEVTKGGVATSQLNSKTMEAHQVKGLYFIGEVVDMTGQLGGFNFQWAWASGFVAGHAIHLPT